MNAQRQKQWQKILFMTQQMRELAVPNDSLTDLSVDEEYAKQPWQAITQLETDRLDLLKNFFADNIPPEDASEIAEGIKQVQLIDQQVFAISSSIQKDISSVFSKLGNAQRAAAAYTNTAKP